MKLFHRIFGREVIRVREERIFVPYAGIYDTGESWYPTLLSTVIQPLSKHLRSGWFFFTRYVAYADSNLNVDPGSRDGGGPEFDERIVDEPGFSRNGLFMSVRFRYSGNRDECEELRLAGLRLIHAQGLRCLYDFNKEYDVCGDLGSGRFIGEAKRTQEFKARRSELVAGYLHSTSKLVLDTLATTPRPDGSFYFEDNGDPGANLRNSLTTPLHLFLNSTAIPSLGIAVTMPNGQVGVIG